VYTYIQMNNIYIHSSVSISTSDRVNDDDDDVYLRLRHGKGFHNLVYMSYIKHMNPACKALVMNTMTVWLDLCILHPHLESKFCNPLPCCDSNFNDYYRRINVCTLFKKLACSFLNNFLAVTYI
jgi:hypothetical protein